MRYPEAEEPYRTRCRISHRPPFRTREPLFYCCDVCGQVTVVNGTPEKEPSGMKIVCCGKEVSSLTPMDATWDDTGHRMRFTVFGGFDHTSTEIKIEKGAHPMEEAHRIAWVYLWTYQGGQLKHLPFPGKSAATFCFADEDAYVYCDRDICRMGREHCQFQCRRGITAYAYCTTHGLFKLRLGDEEILEL